MNLPLLLPSPFWEWCHGEVRLVHLRNSSSSLLPLLGVIQISSEKTRPWWSSTGMGAASHLSLKTGVLGKRPIRNSEYLPKCFQNIPVTYRDDYNTKNEDLGDKGHRRVTTKLQTWVLVEVSHRAPGLQAKGPMMAVKPKEDWLDGYRERVITEPWKIFRNPEARQLKQPRQITLLHYPLYLLLLVEFLTILASWKLKVEGKCIWSTATNRTYLS